MAEPCHRGKAQYISIETSKLKAALSASQNTVTEIRKIIAQPGDLPSVRAGRNVVNHLRKRSWAATKQRSRDALTPDTIQKPQPKRLSASARPIGSAHKSFDKRLLTFPKRIQTQQVRIEMRRMKNLLEQLVTQLDRHVTTVRQFGDSLPSST